MPEDEERPRKGGDQPACMRRILAGFTALLVLASVSVVGVSRVASATEDVLEQTKHELKNSKHELQEAKAKYRAQTRKIRALQKVMNRLATRISRAEGEIQRI